MSTAPLAEAGGGAGASVNPSNASATERGRSSCAAGAGDEEAIVRVGGAGSPLVAGSASAAVLACEGSTRAMTIGSRSGGASAATSSVVAIVETGVGFELTGVGTGASALLSALSEAMRVSGAVDAAGTDAGLPVKSGRRRAWLARGSTSGAAGAIRTADGVGAGADRRAVRS